MKYIPKGCGFRARHNNPVVCRWWLYAGISTHNPNCFKPGVRPGKLCMILIQEGTT